MTSFRTFAIVALVLLTSICKAQSSKIDVKIKGQLDSIGNADQLYRALADKLTHAAVDSLGKRFGIPSDSVYDHLMSLQSIIDSTNLNAISRIIKEYGYPGKTLVGEHTDVVAFYVIQHSSQIGKYLPLLQRAAKEKELNPALVAMMEDRHLTEEGNEQIYGTQLWGNPVKDSVTGVVKPKYYFYPIRDPQSVNLRRKQTGFEETIEEYAKEMGVVFEIKRPWWWKK